MNTEIGVFLGPVFLGILQNHKSVPEGGREGGPKIRGFLGYKKRNFLIDINPSDVCFDFVANLHSASRPEDPDEK
jgi:hypothetical protein